MTIVLLVVGGVLCALGTRLGAAAFAAAAVSAAAGATAGGTAVAATWIAALGAGLALLAPRPRRLAIPAFGAAAVVAAGAASNGALVFAPWMLGTAAAILQRGDEDAGRRWAVELVLCDVFVLFAVGWTAARHGFVRWPLGLDATSAAALALAGLARLPLVGRRGATEAGLFVVRGQVAMLFVLASRAALPREAVVGALVAGSGLFLIGGILERGAHRDAVQEAALLGCALAATVVGWHPRGWAWGALAAGTLIHSLRLAREGAIPDIRAAAAALLRGGGFGLPLLPVATAVAVAAITSGSRAAGVVVAALVAGVAGRAIGAPSRSTRARREGWIETSVATAALVGVVAAGIWPTLLGHPEPRAGEALAWMGGWAIVLIAVAVFAGALMPWPTVPARSAAPDLPRAVLPTQRAGALLAIADTRWTVPVSLGALLVVGGVMWVVGWARGFL